MEKKSGHLGIPIGTSSLLMVFIVLCLSIFGAISYIAAYNDYRLSQKTAENVKAYYNADNLAEEKLSEIMAALSEEPTKEAFQNWLQRNGITVEQEQGAIAASYDILINENMKIAVTVKILYDEKDYSISSWKTVNTSVPEDEPQYLQLFEL